MRHYRVVGLPVNSNLNSRHNLRRLFELGCTCRCAGRSVRKFIVLSWSANAELSGNWSRKCMLSIALYIFTIIWLYMEAGGALSFKSNILRILWWQLLKKFMFWLVHFFVSLFPLIFLLSFSKCNSFQSDLSVLLSFALELLAISHFNGPHLSTATGNITFWLRTKQKLTVWKNVKE
jgi:hypothetical protein